MDVFNLFETKNDNDLMLGIQVVKCLCLQKEFEKRFDISFNKYHELFDRFVPEMSSDYGNKIYSFVFLITNKNQQTTNTYTTATTTHILLSILSCLPKEICDLVKTVNFYGTKIEFLECDKLYNQIEDLFSDIMNIYNLIMPYYGYKFTQEYANSFEEDEIIKIFKTFFNENNKSN